MISNTFSIIVQQRTRELALLRAVGAEPPPGALRGDHRGASSSASSARCSGLGVGILLAKAVTALSAIGDDLPSSGHRRPAGHDRHGAADRRVVTLVAALIPAIRATRVPPLAAMRDVAIDRSGASKIRIGSASSSRSSAP